MSAAGLLNHRARCLLRLCIPDVVRGGSGDPPRKVGWVLVLQRHLTPCAVGHPTHRAGGALRRPENACAHRVRRPAALCGAVLFGLIAIFLALAAGVGAAAPKPPAPPNEKTALAVRAARVDALGHLTDLVFGARLSAEKTIGQTVGAASNGEIAIRVALRSARMASEPRVYSDGVAEVDLEIRLDEVAGLVRSLGILGDGKTSSLADLEHRAMEGSLRASGAGRAPPDVPADFAEQTAAAKPDDLAEMFPAGWERVTAAGRVAAICEARVRAYEAMAALLRGIYLAEADTIADLVDQGPAEIKVFDAFVRLLPVGGEPRMMPDRIAEVEVAAPVRDVIRTLKEIRSLREGPSRWTADDIDRLSVSLKTNRLTVLGRGMPPPRDLHTADAAVAGSGVPLPDWATEVHEARGTARFSEEVERPDEARVLAARSAKVRALADLQKQIGAVKLDDGRTVRQRAAKDEVFRRDLKMFVSSAKPSLYRATEDGKGWEVSLRLPLVRLYEFARPRE